MRFIALLRGLMVAPARGPPRVHRGSRGGLPGGQDRGYDPNHRLRHRVTPPGGVGVERRREMHFITAPSLRFEPVNETRPQIVSFRSKKNLLGASSTSDCSLADVFHATFRSYS